MTENGGGQDKYITYALAIRMLGISSNTMSRLLATGEIPYKEHPFDKRKKFVRLSDIEKIKGLGVLADNSIHRTVRTWLIYALVDPRDDTIHYVGRTINAKLRLQQHLQEVTTNKKKGEWLEELKKAGMSPRMEILEIIECKEEDAERHEVRWIKHLLSACAPLTNIRSVQK